MSPFKRKKLLKNLTTRLALGCGCSSNIPHVYVPKPVRAIPIPKPRSSTFSSSNNGETCTPTSSIFSSGPSNCGNEIIDKETTTNASAASTSISTSASRRWKMGDQKRNTSSISTTAVVMESENPYEDFQESMLEMIIENQIFCAEELVQLLHAFLRLNSPTHHHLILCAFFQVSQYAIVSSFN